MTDRYRLYGQAETSWQKPTTTPHPVTNPFSEAAKSVLGECKSLYKPGHVSEGESALGDLQTDALAWCHGGSRMQ